MPPLTPPPLCRLQALKNHLKSHASDAGVDAWGLSATAGEELATFRALLQEALTAPSSAVEAEAAELSVELELLTGGSLLSGSPPSSPFLHAPPPALSALLSRVDELHAFTVLQYVALFKLVKKARKLSSGPAAALSALPLLLASPLMHSRSLHLLFQRAAKLRGDSSSHGGNQASAFLASASALAPAPAAPAPSATAHLVPSSSAARCPSESESSEDTRRNSLDGWSGGCGGAPPFPPPSLLRCEGCTRPQTRYVVLSCSHTFCWSCVASQLTNQRRRLSRRNSEVWGAGGGAPTSPPLRRASASASSLGRMSALNLAEMAAAEPSSASGRPPLNAGLLAMRLSTAAAAAAAVAKEEEGAGQSEADREEREGLAPQLCCPLCDSVEDLDSGHLEVNALLSDDAYLWVLPGGSQSVRRGSSRSRLAGMDFSQLSTPPGSPANRPMRPGSWTEVGGRWGGAQRAVAGV